MPSLPITHDHISRLPNELRLSIAEFVVIEDDNIDISSRPQQPALSQVWRDLRDSILIIYYTRNKFVDSFEDFDRSLGIAFAAVPESYSINITESIIMDPILPVKIEVTAHMNLMRWMRDVYTIGTSTRYRAQLINYDDVDHAELEYQEVQLACFFGIMREDWKAERNRANQQGTNMMRWQLKKPVIEAIMDAFGIFDWIPWFSGSKLEIYRMQERQG